jgi:plastocyanin
MNSQLSIGLMTMAMVVLGVRTGVAQGRHVVRMEVDEKRDEYRFVPAKVTARSGDVLVFRSVSGGPHSIVFEAGGLDGASRAALNGAMPERSADLSSPLLTENGAQYRIIVPALAQGTYRFFCLPHRAYDMRGELEVR